MTEIIRNLFHVVDERTDRQCIKDPRTKDLLDRQNALQEEIIRRLGDNGRDMMEALAALNLKLEDIHDEAMFRAALRLGALIVRPQMGSGRTGTLPARRLKAAGR